MITWHETHEHLQTGELVIQGTSYQLVQTSVTAPEQYDVLLNGLEVGYLRLRNGNFRADYKAGVTETVYSYSDPQGSDAFFEDARERYLTTAVQAIHDRHCLKSS